MDESPKPLFAVYDEYELLALWRVLAEAKFQPDPDDLDLWGSPFVNALAKRIDEANFQCTKDKGDTEGMQRHLDWRNSFDDNVVLPVVKKNLARDATLAWWKNMSADDKLTYVVDCIAPFEVSIDRARELIREAEACAPGG